MTSCRACTDVFEEDVTDLRGVRVLNVERLFKVGKKLSGEAIAVVDVAAHDLDPMERKHFRSRVRLLHVTLRQTS